jgi:hypothetical protein
LEFVEAFWPMMKKTKATAKRAIIHSELPKTHLKPVGKFSDASEDFYDDVGIPQSPPMEWCW